VDPFYGVCGVPRVRVTHPVWWCAEDSGVAGNSVAPVAQRIEHLTTDQKVGGSNPSGRTLFLTAPAGCTGARDVPWLPARAVFTFTGLQVVIVVLMSSFTTLITGASSGLGAELARQSAALGHDLALCARRTDRLDELSAEITASHPDVTVRTYALDVTDPDAVREVFQTADSDAAESGGSGGLDRVVVNAGLGKGRKIGSGKPEANRETATTNVLGALAQAEAAMEIFRAANGGSGAGHLVLVSSVTAIRGNRKAMATYGATKAFVENLGEGIQSELVRSKSPIDATILLPGYIESEMTARNEQGTPLMVDTETGVRSMVAAIEARKRRAFIPGWPWRLVGLVLRVLPLKVVARLM
jgi:short-subunit dehydrogenase